MLKSEKSTKQKYTLICKCVVGLLTVLFKTTKKIYDEIFCIYTLCEYINWFENYKKNMLCLLIKIQWFCNRSLSYTYTGLDRLVIEVIPVLNIICHGIK